MVIPERHKDIAWIAPDHNVFDLRKEGQPIQRQMRFDKAPVLLCFQLVDQQIKRTPTRPLIDAALADVRAALDPMIFAEAFAAGQALSLEEAFAMDW